MRFGLEFGGYPGDLEPAEVCEQFSLRWPGMDPRFTLETIERFGKEVIPAIKRRTPECPLP